MIFKDLNPRIFLEYRLESVEITYSEAELAAYVFRLGWGRKVETVGLGNVDEKAKRLDKLLGKKWKFRAVNFRIIIGKKEQILSPYYAFLLFVGERHNWDLAQLVQYFGTRDLRKALHMLKELLPFLQIPEIDGKHNAEVEIDEKKKASLKAFSWENVTEIAKRLKEENKLAEIDLAGKKEIFLEDEEKRRKEERRKREEERARKKAEEQAQEIEWRKKWLDKKLRAFLKEWRTRNKDRSYGIDAIKLAHGTEDEKERVRKEYDWKIKEWKKEKGWE